MLSTYISLVGNFFFYIENNYIILCSKLGIWKVQNTFFKNLFIYEQNNLVSSYFDRSLMLYLKDLFLIINFGYFSKFKIIGVGYKQFYIDNIVIYKLRYSHLIYKILPFQLLSFKKTKKKKFYTVFGINKNNVNSIVDMWTTYRISNVYTKKGFFKKNKKVYFKTVVKKRL